MQCLPLRLLFGTFLLLGHQLAVSAQTASKPQKSPLTRPLPGSNRPIPPQEPGDQFLGEWKWASAGQVFQLTLTRNPAYVSPRYPNLPPRSVIIGHFVYTRNGTVIDRSLTTGPVPFAAFGSTTNNRNIEMQFYDQAANKYGDLTLRFPSFVNPNTLNWSLRESEYYGPPKHFLVPMAMTLTRQ